MKFKGFLKVLIVFVVIAGILVGWAMINDYQKEQKTNEILDTIKYEQTELDGKIQEIINSTVVVKQEELPDSLLNEDEPLPVNPDISSIVTDALDTVITEEKGFSDLKALTSDTFECTYNGKDMVFRLIGLKSNGDIEGLQTLLDNATDLNVEYDTVKSSSNGNQLIYLWDGEADSSGENMINIQMILNKYTTTNYLNTNDSILETPNIKYSTMFIKYQKVINSQ